LKENNMNKKINVLENIHISESITIYKESSYLLISNKQKVSDLLNNSGLDQNNIIDIFISLHIVLEVGINTLFRQLIDPMFKKEEIIENLDKINFIHKTEMFVYYSEFNFKDLKKAKGYLSIINKLINFSEMRNKLLHGHSISTRFEIGNNKNIKSKLSNNLNLKKLQKQLNDFCFILEGMSFFLDSLNMGLTESRKKIFKESYLDYSFLPITHFD